MENSGRFFKNYYLIIAWFIFFISAIALLSPLWINYLADSKIYSYQNIPEKRVAIVFGAAIWGKETPSDVLADRIKTAAALYKTNKVKKILLSGDNSKIEHNEPETMKNYALSLGINPDDVQLDYAGFRTYDTCERAKHVFQLDEAILVTQQAHLQRAIFLCEKAGIESTGVSANLRLYSSERQQNSREWFAKIYSFWEGYFFRHKPKFLGEKIEI